MPQVDIQTIGGKAAQLDASNIPYVHQGDLDGLKDSVAAGLRTDVIQNGLLQLTPQFTFTQIAGTTTDGAIVTAVVGKRIRVLQVIVNSNTGALAGVTFNSKPAGAGTAISSALMTAGNIPLPFVPTGWFQSNSGEGLTATTANAVAVNLTLTYVLV